MEIHRNPQFEDTREAWLDALFLFSSDLLKKKCKSLGITYAWHGASKKIISKFFEDNAESGEEQRDNGSCRALYPSDQPHSAPLTGQHHLISLYFHFKHKFSIFSLWYWPNSHIYVNCSVLNSQVDDYGLKYIVFCRIIGDQARSVPAWNPYVDNHIQPLFVVL